VFGRVRVLQICTLPKSFRAESTTVFLMTQVRDSGQILIE
jgi:hypothetical protein